MRAGHRLWCRRGAVAVAAACAPPAVLRRDPPRPPLGCRCDGGGGAAAAAARAEDEKASERAFWISGASPGSQHVLASQYDLYNGVIVEPKAVPRSAGEFRQRLRSSLEEWKRLKKAAIWLQVGIEDSELIPVATREFGFEFHHAERGHVMLTRWLPEDRPNTLPQNASHTVGVGAIVLDESGRVLLVRERSGPAARLGIWKVPTGLVDSGEDIHDAALREVREETGVAATFEYLGGFILNHQGNTAHPNKSNIFFIARCRATSTAIATQESEIAEARWFTMEEWGQLPFPEEGSVWHAINRTVLDGGACVDNKWLPLGSSRRGHRLLYYPRPSPPPAAAAAAAC